MIWRALLLTIAGAVAVIVAPAPAATYRQAGSPQLPPICSCDPPPQPRSMPSDQALAFARRIVLALDDGVIWKRVKELVARAEQGPGSKASSRTVSAISRLEPAKHFGWEAELHQRAVDHAAFAYAERYSLRELRDLAKFFESPVGQKFLDNRDRVAEAVTADLNTSDFDEDFLNVVCRKPLRRGPGAGEHGYVRRLHHRFQQSISEPVPEWCAAEHTSR